MSYQLSSIFCWSSITESLFVSGNFSNSEDAIRATTPIDRNGTIEWRSLALFTTQGMAVHPSFDAMLPNAIPWLRRRVGYSSGVQVNAPAPVMHINNLPTMPAINRGTFHASILGENAKNKHIMPAIMNEPIVVGLRPNLSEPNAHKKSAGSSTAHIKVKLKGHSIIT